MAIIVPSRFSLLKIVEDDYLPPKPKENNKTKKNDGKNVTKTDDKKNKNSKNNKHNHKMSNGNNQSNKKKHHSSISQMETTTDKNKDMELINDKFEEDLQQALLLSKLEIEDRTLNNNSKENDSSNKINEQFQVQVGNKKQKKKSHLNTSEPELITNDFNDLQDFDIDKINKNFIEDSLISVRIKKETKDDGKSNHKRREPPSNEEIRGSQLQSILEKKEQEISELKLEIVSLKDDLFKVKNRNKKLCNIIAQGEMKDKAEALAEVERLREVQSELTNTIASLHAQLEQERSKGSSTTKVDTKFKDKKKKSANEKEI